MSRSNECPRCGAYVSPYAAGCSICGTDVARRRWPLQVRLALPFSAPGFGEGAALTLLMVVIALFAPLYGMLLAGLVLWDRQKRGHRTMRNMAIVALGLALIAFFLPTLPYGRFGPVG